MYDSLLEEARFEISVPTRIVFGWAASGALAVTPGWECVPATAGQPVLSGGTGGAPSCSSGTAVLAPTYVSSGVGGEPTVEFSAVNVQIVDGNSSDSTSVTNGTAYDCAELWKSVGFKP